jgi:hypothetical protein
VTTPERGGSETAEPLSPNALPVAFIDEVLKPWIATGTPNN